MIKVHAKIYSLIIFLFLLVVLIPSKSFAEIYNYKFKYSHVNESNTLSAELSIKSENHKISYKSYDLAIGNRKLFNNDSWSGEIHYRTIYNKLVEGDWEIENRPYLQITKSIKFDSIDLRFRSRQEFRFKRNEGSKTYNRLRILSSFVDNPDNLSTFIGNEFYYSFNDRKLVFNKFITGINISMSSNNDLRIYYESMMDLEAHNDKSSIVISFSF